MTTLVRGGRTSTLDPARSQLLNARAVVEKICGHATDLIVLHSELQVVLDAAQNGPPDGMADGTIDADAFISLRQLERQLVYLFSTVSGASRV